jgi:hypothetical protein
MKKRGASEFKRPKLSGKGEGRGAPDRYQHCAAAGAVGEGRAELKLRAGDYRRAGPAWRSFQRKNSAACRSAELVAGAAAAFLRGDGINAGGRITVSLRGGEFAGDRRGWSAPKAVPMVAETTSVAREVTKRIKV